MPFENARVASNTRPSTRVDTSIANTPKTAQRRAHPVACTHTSDAGTLRRGYPLQCMHTHVPTRVSHDTGILPMRASHASNARISNAQKSARRCVHPRHTRVDACIPTYAYMLDRKSTRLNSSHTVISYAVFCLKKKKLHNPSYT